LHHPRGAGRLHNNHSISFMANRPHVLSGRRELGGLRDDRQCAYTLNRDLALRAAETTANFG
jgi:hypothetical protein